ETSGVEAEAYPIEQWHAIQRLGGPLDEQVAGIEALLGLRRRAAEVARAPVLQALAVGRLQVRGSAVAQGARRHHLGPAVGVDRRQPALARQRAVAVARRPGVHRHIQRATLALALLEAADVQLQRAVVAELERARAPARRGDAVLQALPWHA